MRQASTVKKTTAKTATPKIKAETPLPQTTSIKTPKSRVEIPSSQKVSSKGDILKKIQEKAYELYLQRNGAAGSPEDDWVMAEKIVKASLKG